MTNIFRFRFASLMVHIVVLPTKFWWLISTSESGWIVNKILVVNIN